MAMSSVPKEIHSVKSSGEGAICDFKKLPLLTDLMNVKCASPLVPN